MHADPVVYRGSGILPLPPDLCQGAADQSLPRVYPMQCAVSADTTAIVGAACVNTVSLLAHQLKHGTCGNMEPVETWNLWPQHCSSGFNSSDLGHAACAVQKSTSGYHIRHSLNLTLRVRLVYLLSLPHTQAWRPYTEMAEGNRRRWFQGLCRGDALRRGIMSLCFCIYARHLSVSLVDA